MNRKESSYKVHSDTGEIKYYRCSLLMEMLSKQIQKKITEDASLNSQDIQMETKIFLLILQ